MRIIFLSRRFAAALATVVSLLLPVVLRAAPIGPTPYSSIASSPLTGVDYDYFHYENFEDDVLNTPGASVIGGSVLQPGALTDSVDGDDGSVDGFGTGGHSYYSAGSASLTFVFDASVLGALPTHVGVVWTDVGFTRSGAGFGDVLFEAFDSSNMLIGSIGPEALGDGLFGGQTAEDRFFGFIDGGGIASIRISMPASDDWEIDHLQYGHARRATAVPEPSALMLFAAGIFAFRFARRRVI